MFLLNLLLHYLLLLVVLYLQYKMFLLNYVITHFQLLFEKFTIQNVPIKLENSLYYEWENLKFTIQNVPIKYRSLF